MTDTAPPRGTHIPRWQAEAQYLRRDQARQLPDLIRPPRIPPIGRGLVVVGVLGWAVAGWYVFDRGRPGSRTGLARRLRRGAERLGTTYIKLAQIISAGGGVFPEELVTEFRKCRDRVPPESLATITETIEEDLGAPLSDLFASLEVEPLAAASIAQVHAAVLPTGEEVVVKVQRPKIDRVVARDLRVLAWLAPRLIGRIPVAALANPPALVELFAETILEELDFRVEAANMVDVARVLSELGRHEFVVPTPNDTLVTRRVLVMERIRGFPFDDVIGMTDAGIDTEAVVKAGLLGFLEGAFLHGVFHGDLHGGNLFVLPDGRIGMVDFGITGRLTERQRIAFLKMMMAATANDRRGQIAALCELGALPPDTDIDAVVVDLGLDRPPIDPTKMDPDQLVSELRRILRSLLAYGARLPKPLMLYVKNLVFIDGAIGTLAPQLDMFGVVTEIATHFAVNRGAEITTQLGLGTSGWDVDLDGIKSSFGVDPAETNSLTYAQLQERRALINSRLMGRALE